VDLTRSEVERERTQRRIATALEIQNQLHTRRNEMLMRHESLLERIVTALEWLVKRRTPRL